MAHTIWSFFSLAGDVMAGGPAVEDTPSPTSIPTTVGDTMSVPAESGSTPTTSAVDVIRHFSDNVTKLLHEHLDGLIWLAITLIVALAVGRLLRMLFRRLASRLESRGKRVRAIAVRSLDRGVVFLAFSVGMLVGLTTLAAGSPYEQEATALSNLLLVLALAYTLYRLVDVVEVWLGGIATKTESRLDDMMIPLVRTTLRVAIVVVALLTATEMLVQRPISAIVAGLGVGGIAIGLAAQDTIKNFFGSIMLFSDRPFEMGDRVVIDGHDGPVETVGFRSTRIRTLEGHLVTVPNGELANKTILNIGKRPNIRRVMNLGITYDTPPEKVERAIEILREILDHHEGMNPELPPRVLFNDFKDCSLNLMVIYWYHPPDYWAYAEFSERVNFEILRRFNEEGIEFAFPTQTVFVARDPNRSFWEGMPVPPT